DVLPLEIIDVQKEVNNLNVLPGDLILGDDIDCDEISLEGLQQELEECRSDEDYINESDNLVSLQAEIRECDAILTQMESLLGGFQVEIGSISSEIKTLQEQSMGKGLRLRNRK
ncbi:hypothetical protein KI387_008668, partial [Taxus chinensis]